MVCLSLLIGYADLYRTLAQSRPAAVVEVRGNSGSVYRFGERRRRLERVGTYEGVGRNLTFCVAAPPGRADYWTAEEEFDENGYSWTIRQGSTVRAKFLSDMWGEDRWLSDHEFYARRDGVGTVYDFSDPSRVNERRAFQPDEKAAFVFLRGGSIHRLDVVGERTAKRNHYVIQDVGPHDRTLLLDTRERPCIQTSPDGRFAWVTANLDAYLLDLQTHAVSRQRIPDAAGASDWNWSHDGRILYFFELDAVGRTRRVWYATVDRAEALRWRQRLLRTHGSVDSSAWVSPGLLLYVDEDARKQSSVVAMDLASPQRTTITPFRSAHVKIWDTHLCGSP